ncbi:MAG TPA: RidA family protein [Saprospiraceae bacterium]|nr:RidA family protein [Saprospiraceae bacterium]
MHKEKYSSGAQWESIVGYSRAVLTGQVIEVSGTTAIQNGQVVCIGDPYGQTLRILEIIREALAHFGAQMDNVTRTRIYVTDISHWEQVGKAHGQYFKDIRPATSMVQVASLIDPHMLVEIEATAVLPTNERNENKAL